MANKNYRIICLIILFFINSAIVKAEDIFDKFIAYDSSEDEKREYNLAVAKYKDKEFKKASKLFENFIQKYPKSKMLNKAYFWYGESLLNQQDYTNASLKYLLSYKNNPKGDYAMNSLIKLAISTDNLNKKNETCEIIKKLNKEFPSKKLSSSQKINEIKEKHKCF